MKDESKKQKQNETESSDESDYEPLPVKEIIIKPAAGRRSSLRTSNLSFAPEKVTIDDKKSSKNVVWNTKNLQEQEAENLANPPKKKITEPKTPYVYHEDTDDEYLKKLNEINKIRPSVR
jgi:hypothetical protein